MPERNRGPLKPGLYLVATPIGNLRDITLRALDTLVAVDVLYCEDTRVSGKLLKAYDIRQKLQSYNDHSDEKKRAAILESIAGGEAVGLISDAGMPLISDPGYKLVRECVEAGLAVTSLPGANAPLTALQLSGLPSDAFAFLGFLPAKDKARRDVLERWRDVPGTLIAFESAGRLLKTLTALAELMPGREVAVTRELTKLYEQVRRGVAADLLAFYEAEGAPKGEIVLVIGPPAESGWSEEDLEQALLTAMETMRVKEAAQEVAQRFGVSKKQAYELALRLKER